MVGHLFSQGGASLTLAIFFCPFRAMPPCTPKKGKRTKGKELRSPDATKSEVVVPERRIVDEATRASQEVRAEVPGAPAKNTIFPRTRPRRISVRAAFVIVLVIPVRTPLPNIPRHIHSSVWTCPRWIRSHRLRFSMFAITVIRS